MKRPGTLLDGFTLVELLVVIAIVALLIGVTLPSLAASRRQARAVACQANLRSCGQMIQIYAMVNDNRIPRGPSSSGPNPLLDGTIATNVLWGRAAANDEFIGLGLALKKRGNSEHEFLFCPGDDRRNVGSEIRNIGRPGVEAHGSYLYRQMDKTPAPVAMEGRLDNLGINEIVGGVDSNPHPLGCVHDVPVHALALDLNRDGTGQYLSSNHRGGRVNVLYADGSVSGFENSGQGCSSGRRPWGTISRTAVAKLPGDISEYLCELDRIFVAADWGRYRDPNTAPVPVCGQMPEALASPSRAVPI